MSTMTKRYTYDELSALPTISQGHTDDLKIDTGNGERVWLSRMTREDGAEWDHAVTVERYIDGKWVTVEEYDGNQS